MPPDPEQMTQEERARWEMEVLGEVFEEVGRLTKGGHEVRRILEIGLHGSYPDTTVVVRLRHPAEQAERVQKHHLWQVPSSGTPLNRTPDGHLETPYTTGMLMTTAIYGG